MPIRTDNLSVKLDKLKRRLKRNKLKIKELEKLHKGNELDFTYHGGFSLGYLKGKVSVLDDVIDILQEQ